MRRKMGGKDLIYKVTYAYSELWVYKNDYWLIKCDFYHKMGKREFHMDWSCIDAYSGRAV